MAVEAEVRGRMPGLEEKAGAVPCLVQAEMELRAGTGFIPLADYMPWDAAERGWSVPWSERDLELRQWTRARLGRAEEPSRASSGLEAVK